jgi:hypothetical protein
MPDLSLDLTLPSMSTSAIHSSFLTCHSRGAEMECLSVECSMYKELLWIGNSGRLRASHGYLDWRQSWQLVEGGYNLG